MLPGHTFELLIILVIALMVFGPQKLPEVTSSLGRAVREFRRATSELQESVMAQADPGEQAEETSELPEPEDEPDAAEQLRPTIDTLAQRRDARLRTRQEAQTADQSSETPPTAS